MQQEFEGQAHVFYLPDSINALDELVILLEAFDSVDKIHLVSHGAAGQLPLGGPAIDISSLHHELRWIQELNRVMTGEGAIHLYGCNVAADE